MLTFFRCQNLIAKGRSGRKKLKPNTYLIQGEGFFTVELHGNRILRINQDNSFVVSSCGWTTKTTKDRLNEFGPVQIWQKDFQWYYRNGTRIAEFHDNITVFHE